MGMCERKVARSSRVLVVLFCTEAKTKKSAVWSPPLAGVVEEIVLVAGDELGIVGKLCLRRVE